MSCQFNFFVLRSFSVKDIQFFTDNLGAYVYLVKPTESLPFANIHAVACFSVALAFAETVVDSRGDFFVALVCIPVIHRVYKLYFTLYRLSPD